MVCVPSASGVTPAATAAALPEDDPPGVCARSCGFRVGPGSKYANSVVTVFPKTTAPASRRRDTTAACGPSRVSGGRLDPARVSKPSTWKMSFTPTGTPYSGGGVSPSKFAVTRLAAEWTRRRRSSSLTNARTSSSVAANRSRHCFAYATGGVVPSRSVWTASASGCSWVGIVSRDGGRYFQCTGRRRASSTTVFDRAGNRLARTNT
jgi:hypothetical protein